MNLDDIVVPSITGAIGAFISWLVGRKKENVEVQGNAIDNVDKAVKMWQDTAEKMSKRVDELSDKVDALTQEVHSLRIENADLKLKLGIDESQPIKRKRNKPNQEI
jgi:hypothetical protein